MTIRPAETGRGHRRIFALALLSLLVVSASPKVLGASGANSAANQVSPSASPWRPVGPFGITSTSGVFNWDSGPDSGRVNAIAIDPSSPSTIYAGAAGGGVWKSTDGGGHWTQLTDGMPDLAISAITISQTGKIYVGTGDSDGSFGGGLAKSGDGIYVSSDGGNTWTSMGQSTFGTAVISGILINPANPNEIIVSTGVGKCCKYSTSFDKNDNVGIFLSTNGGSTWSQQLTANDVATGIAELTTVPVQSNQGIETWLYAGDFLSNIWAYYMPNYPSWSGGFWQAFPQGDLSSCSSVLRNCRITLASSPDYPDWLYAAMGGADNQLAAMGAIDVVNGYVALFNLPQNTTNTSNPFGTETVPPCGEGQSFYDLAIAVDPNNGNRIYFGCSELFRSDDGGVTWTDLGGYTNNSQVHPDVHAIVVASDGRVYVGDDGGIYTSSDLGKTWTSLNAGLQITQFYSVSVDPTGELLGASQDNGCEASFDGGAHWQIINTGDGAWTGTARVNSNALMCEYPFAQFEMSLDGGRTNMKVLTSGLPNNIQQKADFVTPMAQDPRNPGTLYVGADGVYKTTDYGGSWASAGGTFANTTMTALAVSPADSSVIYAGSLQGGGFMSTDGGSSWQRLFSASSDVVESVAADDLNASVAVFALASQETPVLLATLGGVPEPLGVTGLPQSAVNTVKIVQGVILVGLDEGGVYYSADFGKSWAKLGSGLPAAQVTDIAVGAGMIVAATFGRGAWALSVPQLTEVPVTVDFGVVGGGGGFSAPALNYFSGGRLQQADLNSGSATLSVDYAGILNVSSQIVPGSTAQERWASAGQTADLYVTSPYNATVTFYHQYEVNFTYQVKGGGKGYSSPSLQYRAMGASYNSTVGTVTWADAGSAVTYQGTLLGSGGEERWQSGPAPVVSGPGTVTGTYAHEYFVTTRAEAGGNVAPATGWYEAGASITFSASSSPGWKFGSWTGTGPAAFSGTNATDSMPLAGPVSEDAVFDPGLTVEIGGGGSVAYSYGTASGSLSSGNSTVYVPANTTVVLAASPSLFYRFTAWGGAVGASTAEKTSLAVSSPSVVKANFELDSGLLAEAGVAVVVVLGAVFFLLRRTGFIGARGAPPPPPPPV